METRSIVNEHWSAVLASLPETVDLERSSFEFGALLRRRQICDGQSLLRLALAYGPCGLSLRGAAAWAELNGIGALSDVAVLKRLRGSANWLEHIVCEILSSRRSADKLSGHRLQLVDGTCLSRPGSRGTDWRIHTTYDLDRGQFSHFDLTDGHGGESLARSPVTPGE